MGRDASFLVVLLQLPCLPMRRVGDSEARTRRVWSLRTLVEDSSLLWTREKIALERHQETNCVVAGFVIKVNSKDN